MLTGQLQGLVLALNYSPPTQVVLGGVTPPMVGRGLETAGR